jgi:hypothetical protein
MSLVELLTIGNIVSDSGRICRPRRFITTIKKGEIFALFYVSHLASYNLARVVQAKFNWMWRHAKFVDLFHLQCDVAINPIFSKYTTAG